MSEGNNPFRIASPKPARQPKDLRKSPPSIQQSDPKIEAKMKQIKYKIAILSGKGGVGKSFVSSNLAMAIAASGNKVGIVDIDFHGPSVPKMLGVRGQFLTADDNGINPVTGPFGIKVVSIDFLLPRDDTPVVWRGAIKHTAIKQFLGDVIWGDLDFLLIDMPPGTGDEALSITQLLPTLDGFVIVTIPSEVSTLAVKKSINFTKAVKTKIIGVVENMSYFMCPSDNKPYYIFGEGKGKKMADEMGVPLLGQVPLEPSIAQANDAGEPFFLSHPESPASKEFLKIADAIVNSLRSDKK
ncbi:Mrp/NBP35 family ATP-binding protein [Sulfuracidifex metallicus]|jgi:ATP-binding protein involved in chromosome partitioning|uniref:Iron-sulfur cluster carrier protein n=1 Tax=Sulfuracidifex metallicus DSM 6482 = JCM 9184 TaxID=523847 RepID=A0A6A9QL57_SULME|nr:Mrp/NBP35 family ATP-binding protein [Sulfuracidifex metallicus]MCY0850665.1 Mrp/NBP35 family ATP-binding protein [Sulfuracidifex metallicus]MUN28418.1 P-loop NTPase [Sulfuracidifex metallicus DSM 6482 = JCM 9184]WOE51064.1 Mrp/NBP35 family ATP-binding protein [Sulfuracidifex metallicus DSM 6482 = JCM 9184]